jgi:hypothetical protein
MSEKSLAISCVAAAIVCGTFFYPEPPVTGTARAQPAPVKSVAAPATVAMNSIDTPAIASNAAKVSHAATPATRDWGNRIASK